MAKWLAMNAAKLFCVLLVVGWAHSTIALEWDFSGYGKSYAVYQDQISVTDSVFGEIELAEEQFQLQNAVRLMLASELSSTASFEMHYDIQPIYHSADNLDFNLAAANQKNHYRIDDIHASLDETNHLTTYQNLDRLNIQYHLENGELTLGRQAMSFGSARNINPTDIFLPFTLLTLNQEYRSGIDAIRYQHYINDFFTLDTGLVLGTDIDRKNSAGYFRLRQSINSYDIETMLITMDKANLYGVGIQGAIADLGAWLEAAYMDAEHQQYWRVSTGLDYAVNESIFAMVEYHYNGAGEKQTENYLSNASSTAYQKYGVHLMGQHYLMPSISWTANALLNVSAAVYYNLDDSSALFNIAAETSWSDNVYSQFGLFQGFGKQTQSITQAGSEYGDSPLMLYTSLGVYF